MVGSYQEERLPVHDVGRQCRLMVPRGLHASLGRNDARQRAGPLAIFCFLGQFQRPKRSYLPWVALLSFSEEQSTTELIWDVLLMIHNGCPGNIFFSEMNTCRGPDLPPIILRNMKNEQKCQKYKCSHLQGPHSLHLHPNPIPVSIRFEWKNQSRLTFYSWFTNPLKVPDLALPVVPCTPLKNKCVEKPLGS